MRRSLRLAGWLLAVLVAAAGGHLLARQFSTPSPTASSIPPPILTVPESDLAFGEVWDGVPFERAIRVTNRGTSRVAISRWSISCNCVGVEPARLTLAAGETAMVKVRMQLSSTDGSVDGASKRGGAMPAAQSLSPVIEGLDSPPPRWTLTGTVKPRWRFEAGLVDFGTESREGGPTVHRRFFIETFVPCDDITCEVRSSPVAAKATPVFGQPGRWLAEMSVSPEVPIGSLNGSVVFRFVTPHAPVTTMQQVQVVGTKEGDIVAMPRALVFPVVRPDEPAEAYICLSSRTGRAFDAAYSSGDGDPLSVERASELDGNGIRVFRVRTASSSSRERNSTIRFTARVPGRPDAVVSVAVTGWGVP